MLDPELLAMLVCPETHNDLCAATSEELVWINEAIREGRMQNIARMPVTEKVDGALIRADRAVAYPIRDEIPVMLIEEGMDIRGLALAGHSGVTTHA